MCSWMILGSMLGLWDSGTSCWRSTPIHQWLHGPILPRAMPTTWWSGREEELIHTADQGIPRWHFLWHKVSHTHRYHLVSDLPCIVLYVDQYSCFGFCTSINVLRKILTKKGSWHIILYITITQEKTIVMCIDWILPRCLTCTRTSGTLPCIALHFHDRHVSWPLVGFLLQHPIGYFGAMFEWHIFSRVAWYD